MSLKYDGAGEYFNMFALTDWLTEWERQCLHRNIILLFVNQMELISFRQANNSIQNGFHLEYSELV